jgi:hypothetical protein
MTSARRKSLDLAVGAATLPAVMRIASAQTYPKRSVTMIANYPAGLRSSRSLSPRGCIQRSRAAPISPFFFASNTTTSVASSTRGTRRNEPASRPQTHQSAVLIKPGCRARS